MASEQFVAVCVCACGLRYDDHAWKCLPFIRRGTDPCDGVEYELRRCECKETLARPLTLHCEWRMGDETMCMAPVEWRTRDLGELHHLCDTCCREAMRLNDFVPEKVGP